MYRPANKYTPLQPLQYCSTYSTLIRLNLNYCSQCVTVTSGRLLHRCCGHSKIAAYCPTQRSGLYVRSENIGTVRWCSDSVLFHSRSGTKTPINATGLLLMLGNTRCTIQFIDTT